MNAENTMQALMPEVEQLAISAGGGPRAPLSMAAVAAYLGGYRGPHWRIDRRSQPLRGRRSAERVRTLLRRKAVTRLRMEGLSFRGIGRELGISQVAAWKLWHQVLRDVTEVGRAERAGWERLALARQQQDAGDDLPTVLLLMEASDGLGRRAMAALLKAKGPVPLRGESLYG